MALTAVRPAMNDNEQNLHPFFSKAQREAIPNVVSTPLLADGSNEISEDAPNDRPRKKRSKKAEGEKGGLSGKGQTSLNFVSRQRAHSDCATPNGGLGQPDIDEDPNHDRRKRQKTGSPNPPEPTPSVATSSIGEIDWRAQLQLEAQRQIGLAEQATSDATVQPHTTSPDESVAKQPPESGVVGDTTPPKKQIKITKSGKLLSSPPKSTLPVPTTPKRRRGRKAAKPTVAPTVTIIKYGSDSAQRQSIGQKIDAILNGPKSKAKAQKPPKKNLSKPIQPPKVTHPFFSGKAGSKTDKAVAKDAADQHPPTPRKSAVTPGKLRAEARRDRSPGLVPGFGFSHIRNKTGNQSGLFEPSWPTRETCHVRNLEVTQQFASYSDEAMSLVLRPRKFKHKMMTLSDNEEIMARLSRDLSVQRLLEAKQCSSDFTPPQNVRLPSRLLVTGLSIQQMVREHVRTQGYHDSDAVGDGHPAVQTLFRDIEHILTPFDEGRCESQSWVQKYSPKLASHVLQSGNEAFVLKDWLQSLTVMAVGGAQKPKSDIVESRGPPKKKRKKAVDDFIVFDGDDDDDEEMIECTDYAETTPYDLRSYRLPTWTRNKNVVLISGPQGCGKSAIVYAVAKELDFEVFEINSGSRRSGKDIQDKVGDMTANHLVNHKRADAPAKETTTDIDTDNERLTLAVKNDIESGRQGTMMNFFKAKPATKHATQPNQRVQVQEAVRPSVQATIPGVNTTKKSQKQSLILFEEADILFEEDQQFWAQVTKLASQSKRPIIVTCNNERQIPVHDLPLAAVLRLKPVPTELATDYMLVMAGREGHILQREAVANLYLSKDCDLRASITELNFWCQMSVGDRKGGLEWMYQRWPPGKDADAEGRLWRVASEGTYQSGMGFLSHDIFEATTNTNFDKEEELLADVWSDWGIGPSKWESTLQSVGESSESSVRSLSAVEAYADALSAADICCRVGLPTYENEADQPTDPSQPAIADKTRLNYTLAAPVLQVDHLSDTSGFDTAMYTQILLLAEHAHGTLNQLADSYTIPRPVTETQYANAILKTKSKETTSNGLSRLDFSRAFDILATPPDAIIPERTSFILTPSSFDRNFRIITQDLAPYVRSIVAHEQILEEQRLRLSNLLSEGGKGKRARTTRASRVALEGGVRETKRRDQWFDKDLSFTMVMATAGKEWAGMGWQGDGQAGEEGSTTGSVTGTQESMDDNTDMVMQGVDEVQVTS